MANTTPPFKGQLAGHGLRMEGRVNKYHGWGSGEGRARCYCGEESPTLPTTAARQRWHREHKAQIAAELRRGVQEQ